MSLTGLSSVVLVAIGAMNQGTHRLMDATDCYLWGAGLLGLCVLLLIVVITLATLEAGDSDFQPQSWE